MKNILSITLFFLAFSFISFSCSEEKKKPIVKSISDDKQGGPEDPKSDIVKILWISFEEAQELMKTNPKKILVDVYTDWCGPCKMMMKNTFTNPTIVNFINENYYAVKWNAETGDTVTFNGKVFTNPGYNPNRTGRNATHDLTKAIAAVNGRLAYPTTLYIDEQWNLITGVQGYLVPERIEPILNFINENQYKKGTEYETYLSTFQSKL